MKPNDMYETAELFSASDFEIYLNYGWTLLDVKAGDDSCPTIFVVGREKEEKQP
jgi:hypothetical protein